MSQRNQNNNKRQQPGAGGKKRNFKKNKNNNEEQETIYDIYGKLVNRKASRNTIEYNEEARL